MNARKYRELFENLADRYCEGADVLFVENVAQWCTEQGLKEPDRDKPLRVIARDGSFSVVIMEWVPEEAVADRLRALSVRSALITVASDRAEMLNSPKKKLAYLFLSEYAMGLPEVAEDPLLADNRAFEEMERLGFFTE